MFQTNILINYGIYYSVPAAAANYTEYSVPIFFLYCLQRLSTLHCYNPVLLKFLSFIFLSVGHKCTLWDKAERKETTVNC